MIPHTFPSQIVNPFFSSKADAQRYLSHCISMYGMAFTAVSIILFGKQHPLLEFCQLFEPRVSISALRYSLHYKPVILEFLVMVYITRGTKSSQKGLLNA